MTSAWATGTVRWVRLGQGFVRYREVGEGPVILFVHGLLVNGDLWRKVVDELADGYRCVAPDLPLGSHARAMAPEADLSPPGLARLVDDFMTALDLRDVTLVGNDTGGAICQLVVAHHPERLERLVLTNCDAYENFLPPALRPLPWGVRVPGFASLVARVLQTGVGRRLLIATFAHGVPAPEVLDSYFSPLARDSRVRRDVTKVVGGISSRYTLEAAEAFPTFRKPVTLVWGEDDLFFPLRFAERLEDDFPDAELELVAGSRTFVPEDRPGVLAEHIRSAEQPGVETDEKRRKHA